MPTWWRRCAPCPTGGRIFGAAGGGERSSTPDGGAGIYVIDNTADGYNLNVTAQLRKTFDFGLGATVGYSYTKAKNNLRSSEIASVLWQSQPMQGNPNNPELAYSEFGQRHRIVGGRHLQQVVVAEPPDPDRPLRRGGGGQPVRGRGRQPVLLHLLR